MTVFFDSNVIVYPLVNGDARKSVAAQLSTAVGYISIQVLNEFATVAHRKLKLSWPDVATP